jgi:hypothetical protein
VRAASPLPERRCLQPTAPAEPIAVARRRGQSRRILRTSVATQEASRATQQRRHRGIVAVQDALAPRRTRWIAQFLQRIQARGFHVHGAECRKVRPDEIPSQPRRKLRVVS